MNKQAKTTWRGAALAGLATGAYFLLKDQSALFKKYQASVQAFLAGATPAPAAPVAPVASTADSAGRTPTAANGHVRDVVASAPPAPDSGSNFTPQNDVHQPAS